MTIVNIVDCVLVLIHAKWADCFNDIHEENS